MSGSSKRTTVVQTKPDLKDRPMTLCNTSPRKSTFAKLIVPVFLAVSTPFLALADGPVSANDRASVVAAIAAEGCTGGHIERDDGGFDVEHATCNGKANYDLRLTSGFKVVSKHWDD